MTDFILNNEQTLRMSAFLVVLTVMAIWEVASPKRRIDIPRLLRWTNNLALVVLDSLVVRVAFPLLAVGVAVIAQENGWGLLNLFDFPSWLAVLAAILLLDLAIFGQHIAFHMVPALWRLHRMHHSDQEFDVTTGLRFHPIEIMLSMAIKMAVVLTIGAPPVAVLIFEVILSATSLFNHSNVRLPKTVDRLVRLVLVTPDMHRVHHSVHPDETNSNYGFSVPWWDRLFGTYIAQPRDGHLDMKIGINAFRERSDLRIDKMLVQPLRNPLRKQSGE